MEGTWIEIRVLTTSEAIEPISGIFYGLDCKGVEIEDPNDILGRETGPLTWDFADVDVLEHKGEVAVVKAYFSEEDNIEDILSFINEKVHELKEMGINTGIGKVEHVKVYEEDWANNWKKYYKPTKIGQKIIVKPIWEDYCKVNDEVVVELDPGMAFGTGTHETTKMCVEALERHVKEDSIVFDIGTGSGILALVASKLNAKHVVGVDLDPVAVDAAKENIAHNNVNNIEVIHGNLVDVVKGKADLVIANILAEVVCILTDDVKKVLKQGGLYITSGIIHDRREMVIEKLKSEGFEILEVNQDGEWNLIVAKLK